MRYIRMLGAFIRASAQQELAYRANFFIALLHSLLNLATGVLGVVVLFGQVKTVRGWDFPATLALLGVYLTVSALRGLVIGPSLEALAGLGQEVMSGNFDFTLLRPANAQFLASFRHWRLFALFDLALGLGVLAVAVARPGQSLSGLQMLAFTAALASGLAILYAMLLSLTALVFWSPGFLFTWVFDGIFQMARYPVGIYPGWLRLVLTWVIPVGLITTVPAQALTGSAPWPLMVSSMLLAAALVAAASMLFQFALRRYTSASS